MFSYKTARVDPSPFLKMKMKQPRPFILYGGKIVGAAVEAMTTSTNR